MKRSKLGVYKYRAATDWALTPAPLRRWQLDGTCPHCDSQFNTRLRTVVDEAGTAHPGLACPDCGGIVLLRDRHGNTVRWSKTRKPIQP